MFKVGIVGGSGYTGNELIRLLTNHPNVTLTAVTSRPNADKRVKDVYPHLSCDLKFTLPDDERLLNCDVVFSALPQTKGFDIIGKLIDKKVRVIDLSADFRFSDLQLYQKTYATTHTRPDLLKNAVYGLTEINRNKIKNATLLANPGCFVTSALLPLMPIKEQIKSLIIDSASGTSGAGRKSDEAYSFCEVSDNFKAYGVFSHRHAPEISEKLGNVNLTFTPHLLPIKRGILSTIYVTVKDGDKTEKALQTAYQNETFVNYSNELPELKHVVNTNRCVYSYRRNGNDFIIISAIDNLLKGASGQAVQNMNVMLGLNESDGLTKDAPV